MAIINSKRNLPGVKPGHFKNTNDCQTVDFPIPERLVVPMVMHMGASCEPLVKKGDTVLVGQKIGESTAAFSAPIHASCSGVVEEITDYYTTMGNTCKAVIIKTDGTQTMDSSVQPPVVTNKDEFLAAIRESGLVGLGGAGFPTHLKLSYKDIDRVNTLVINAAECEPYITADYRECLENTENIVDGVRAVKQYLGIRKVFIGIESNKPKAIEQLDQAFEPVDDVTVVRLKSLYPQGAEKSIVYATSGIVVEKGKLPADCGVLVMNVSSVGFIGKYLKDGVPLISKRITVDGDFVKEPANLRVPIGTPIADVLAHFRIAEGDCGKILMGGPMMGTPVFSADAPVIKNNNALTLLSHKASIEPPTTACIRCGKCIGVCPVSLMPAKLEKAYDKRDKKVLEQLNVNLCINCGCCSYICPAHRHLAQKNQLSKLLLKENTKGGRK